MSEQSSGPSGSENPEAGYGGADAVPDTPDGVAHGAEPGGTRKGSGAPTARVGAGGGLGALWWAVGALVVLALLAYALGLFR